MNMFKKNGGFTLVELIVVIAILAILAGIAIPAYSGYIEKANEAADSTALSAVKTAAMAAYATEGEVTKIEVADVEAGDTLAVTVKNAVGTETRNTDTLEKTEFLTYYGATSFNIDLQTGDTATWNATATGTVKAGWTIE